MQRVGFGYDIHRMVARRPLVLGGVKIPSAKGLSGHSDADVVLHAISDALLGAACLGDIGEHFPDTQKKYKGISSLRLLERVAALLKKKKYSVCNVDIMLLLEAPKIAPYKTKMRRLIAGALGINSESVSIKATTHEGTGEIGRGQAAAAYAVALLDRRGV